MTPIFPTTARRPRPLLLATSALFAMEAAGAMAAPAAAARPPGAEAPLHAAARLWLAGDAAGAAEVLSAPTERGREARLNRAVALLYVGRAEEAEPLLLEVVAEHPRWAPALRVLARAQAALDRPESVHTTLALLASPGAEGRDHFWAGQVFAKSGDWRRARPALARAVAREDDLYLGWLALAEAEEALGNGDAAIRAWTRARDLYGGGDELYHLGRALWEQGRRADARDLFLRALRSPSALANEAAIRRLVPDLPPAAPPVLPPVARVLCAGEDLRYRVKYLLFSVASLSLTTGAPQAEGGGWAHPVRIDLQSNPAYFFLRIRSRYQSLIDAAGSVIVHTNAADDSTSARRAARYEMNAKTGRTTVRHVTEGVFGYDLLPLPPGAQDGLSILYLARAVALTGGSLEVLTAVDGTWKGAQLRSLGPERLKWRGREVPAVRVQVRCNYRGPGGLSGLIDVWISDDESALPYRSKLKGAVGSLVLELEPRSRDARIVERP